MNIADLTSASQNKGDTFRKSGCSLSDLKLERSIKTAPSPSPRSRFSVHRALGNKLYLNNIKQRQVLLHLG